MKLIFIFLFLPLSLLAEIDIVTRELELSSHGIESLSIEAGAGYLKIAGVEGLSKIQVVAKIEMGAMNEDDIVTFLDRKVDLRLEKRGNQSILTAKSKNSIFSRNTPLINLTVKVPRVMNLTIDDGSGSIEISDIVGSIETNDGSGSILIENITGNLTVKDGSGGMTLQHINGSVVVSDGSGSIDILDITQDVRISAAGSGGLSIREVQGSVISGD
ncbi:MAG: hypothetical protein JKY51_03195 [Opitutaceae bacterium]|nr:hypothetical protein [Opitutaceae bacterium]